MPLRSGTTFAFVEAWQNTTVLDEHFTLPHTMEFVAKVSDVLAAPPTVEKLHPDGVKVGAAVASTCGSAAPDEARMRRQRPAYVGPEHPAADLNRVGHPCLIRLTTLRFGPNAKSIVNCGTLCHAIAADRMGE